MFYVWHNVYHKMYKYINGIQPSFVLFSIIITFKIPGDNKTFKITILILKTRKAIVLHLYED